MRSDVLIIGGGLMGYSTALHLALGGARCRVLEKETPGRHASGVNAGGLRKLNRHPAEIPLSLAASGIWHRIRELVDSDCDARFPGQLRVAENAADMARLEQRARQVRALGYTHEEMIDRDELYRRVPALVPGCEGALICRDDGYARPFHALTAFRAKARSLGVRQGLHTRVHGIEREGGLWRVSSDRGEFQAPVLVNCAGAWAGRVARALGDPVPLEPRAPMLMVTERLPHLLDPVLGAASRKLSFKQMQNGTLVIGGAHLATLDFEHQRTQMNWPKLAVSARTVLALFPQLQQVRIVRTWAGIEGFLPDGLPVIGRSPHSPDAYHAFGFSAHGFQLSPVVGRILAQLILEGESELPIEPFSPSRFDAS